MVPDLPGDSPQIKLLNECSRGFNEMNMDIVGGCLHKDYHHVIHPESLGEPALGKEEWIKRMSELGTGYGQTFHSVVETPGKVIIHSTMEVENPYGLNTKCETMYTLHIVTDDDGSLKIKHADVFKDSKVYSNVHQALAAAKASK